MPNPPASPSRAPVDGTWIAFLAIAFVAVGLMGLFATYAGPLPLQRALAREATLDAALAAARGPGPQAALEALRPALDDSADAVLPFGPGIERRITAERLAMRARYTLDSEHVAVRLRWLVCLVTLMAGAFGVAVLHASRPAR